MTLTLNVGITPFMAFGIFMLLNFNQFTMSGTMLFGQYMSLSSDYYGLSVDQFAIYAGEIASVSTFLKLFMQPIIGLLLDMFGKRDIVTLCIFI